MQVRRGPARVCQRDGRDGEHAHRGRVGSAKKRPTAGRGREQRLGRRRRRGGAVADDALCCPPKRADAGVSAAPGHPPGRAQPHGQCLRPGEPERGPEALGAQQLAP